MDDLFQSIYTTNIITNIQESLWKGSGWIIDSVIDHTNSILSLLVLNSADHNQRRNTKANIYFAKRLD